MGLVALWQSSTDIKVAKQDAFDSIKVLEAARAIAYDANGDESRWLLVKMHAGKSDQIQVYADSFQRKAQAIAAYQGRWSEGTLRAEIDRTQKAPAALKGYLADELNNITFPGELLAAEATLLKFLDYLAIDRQIRDLKDERQAVELCLGTQPGQSDWAFDQFDQALSKTIAINQSYFKSSLGGRRQPVGGTRLAAAARIGVGGQSADIPGLAAATERIRDLLKSLHLTA